jgi:hypothetical protein
MAPWKEQASEQKRLYCQSMQSREAGPSIGSWGMSERGDHLAIHPKVTF